MAKRKQKFVGDELKFTVGYDGEDFYIKVDGVRIAKRGDAGTPHENTWIALEPGWRVFEGTDEGLAIEYKDVHVQ